MSHQLPAGYATQLDLGLILQRHIGRLFPIVRLILGAPMDTRMDGIRAYTRVLSAHFAMAGTSCQEDCSSRDTPAMLQGSAISTHRRKKIMTAPAEIGCRLKQSPKFVICITSSTSKGKALQGVIRHYLENTYYSLLGHCAPIGLRSYASHNKDLFS